MAYRFHLLHLTQLLLDRPALGPHFCFTYFSLDRGDQPHEPTLREKVVSAGAQRLDGDLFADGSRDDDKGEIQFLRLEDRKRRPSAEMRHCPVGDHHVPGLLQRCVHRLGRLDPLMARIEPATAQRAQQQLRIVLAILDDQCTQGSTHRPPPRAGGRSFSTSQYSPSWRAASTNWTKSTSLRM